VSSCGTRANMFEPVDIVSCNLAPIDAYTILSNATASLMNIIRRLSAYHIVLLVAEGGIIVVVIIIIISPVCRLRRCSYLEEVVTGD
jgi:hypothetical protein